MADLLADGREYSTLDIIIGAGVCAVNSCIAELGDNGLAIACRRESNIWLYRLEIDSPHAALPPEGAAFLLEAARRMKAEATHAAA